MDKIYSLGAWLAIGDTPEHAIYLRRDQVTAFYLGREDDTCVTLLNGATHRFTGDLVAALREVFGLSSDEGAPVEGKAPYGRDYGF